jgi:predicted transcriptional regulator
MGAINLRDDIQRAVEDQVAQGRAESATAFVEGAVVMLLEELRAEEEEILRVGAAGIADIEAGRFVEISSVEEHDRLMDEIKARVRAAAPRER